MNIVDKIEELAKMPLFPGGLEIHLQDLAPNLKELYSDGKQLQLRQVLANSTTFADTVEIADLK